MAKRKSEGCISLQGIYYEGNDVSAVRGITANAKEHNGEVEEVARYNLSGHPCKPYDKGVQIVVYSDYTTKTIIIEWIVFDKKLSKFLAHSNINLIFAARY